MILCLDSNHVVRRAAIAFVNSCAHNNPEKLRRHIKGAPLNALYQETKVRPELIREVMMGPFKHKIDDGLEIRKDRVRSIFMGFIIKYRKIIILNLSRRHLSVYHLFWTRVNLSSTLRNI